MIPVSGGGPPADRAMTPEGLWLQAEAAAYLRVSPGFLRKSSCPKLLLPSNRAGGRSLLRYDPAEVRAWGEARHIRLRRAG